MIKLKSILLTELDSSVDNINNIANLVNESYKENYTTFLTNPKYNIYRGSKGDRGFISIVTPVQRTSIGTNKVTNILTSMLPSWNKFPNRNKSKYFTTDKKFAESFGSAYYVVPKDNALIACLPADFVRQYLTSNGIFGWLCKKYGIDIREKSPEAFKSQFQLMLRKFSEQDMKGCPASIKVPIGNDLIAFLERLFPATDIKITKNIKDIVGAKYEEIWSEESFIAIHSRKSTADLNKALLKLDPYWNSIIPK